MICLHDASAHLKSTRTSTRHASTVPPHVNPVRWWRFICLPMPRLLKNAKQHSRSASNEMAGLKPNGRSTSKLQHWWRLLQSVNARNNNNRIVAQTYWRKARFLHMQLGLNDGSLSHLAALQKFYFLNEQEGNICYQRTSQDPKNCQSLLTVPCSSTQL